MIRIKRVYEPVTKADGRRFLVERLWPRGIRKEDLAMEAWFKDIAPSTELRKWYSHRLERWDEFVRRYDSELDRNAQALQPLLDAARRGPVTLLFSARDPEHNSAWVLRDHLVKLLDAHRGRSTR